MKRRCILLLLSALALTSPESVAARTWHIAPRGDDSATGDEAAPWRTLARAAQAAEAGDVCLIHAGLYRETLRPNKSGREGAPIVFRAAGDGAVVVNGCEPIRGLQQLDGGPIQQASFASKRGAKNQVFLDGKPLVEARWPNDADGDPMTPDGAPVEGGDSTSLHCSQLPASLQAAQLQDAVLWALVDRAWSSWTARVVDYEPSQKLIRFASFGPGDWVERSHNPKSKRGQFYLVGARTLLDAPGEWYYDEAAQSFLIYPPADFDPQRQVLEAQVRAAAIDLTRRAWITIEGLNVVGATIDLSFAEHCVVRGCTAKHIYATRGGKTLSQLGEPSGVVVSGRFNVLRDCEIAYSDGAGVELAGADNAVINNWIHDIGYLGSYAAPLSLDGARQLVSHNTVHDAARDCIKLRGTQSLIQYNDLSRPGRICHDLGVIYSGGNDGGNTVIRYNYVHENPGHPGFSVGIYLDNYSKNYLLHHNVVWNCANAIRLNRPTGYCMVLHNTVSTDINNRFGPWKGQRTQWGTHVLNNLTGAGVVVNPEVPNRDNVQRPADEIRDEIRRLASQPPQGLDAAVRLDGVNDVFQGKGPDVGAFEYGVPKWRAGHDFKNPPEVQYEPPATPLRNHLRNAAFENVPPKHLQPPVDDLPHWTRTGARQSKVEHHAGFNFPAADARLSVHGYSLRLTGESDDGVSQVVTSLTPGAAYYFSGYVRHQPSVHVVLRAASGDETAEASSADVPLHGEQKWRHVTLRFVARAAEARLELLKPGAGDAHLDDLGAVPAEWIDQALKTESP